MHRFVDKYVERLTHVHLKDELDEKFVALGTGEIDLAGTWKSLRDRNYPYRAMVERDIPSGFPFDSALTGKRDLDGLVLA